MTHPLPLPKVPEPKSGPFTPDASAGIEFLELLGRPSHLESALESRDYRDTLCPQDGKWCNLSTPAFRAHAKISQFEFYSLTHSKKVRIRDLVRPAPLLIPGIRGLL